MKYLFIIMLTLMLVGCGGEPSDPNATPIPTRTPVPPPPESDSGLNFRGRAAVPVDFNVYTIKGEVVTDVESLTRQTKAAQGSSSRYGDFSSSSYFGPQFGGKGFVRLLVKSTEPTTELASPGSIVIIKTTDTKASALLPGDVVTFRCRAQYEAVGAVAQNEDFEDKKFETWELDYCRLFSPLIKVEEGQ